jgi:hypothetical protein
MNRITTLEMELALATHLNYRENLIVPNISSGMGIHECDLLVISKAGYATEVEIKVSKSDLKKDAEKWHKHESDIIKELYFAIPKYLTDCIEYIPARAGIFTVDRNPITIYNFNPFAVVIIRPATIKGNYKFSDEEKFKVARLGTMRIWGLKEKLLTKIINPLG